MGTPPNRAGTNRRSRAWWLALVGLILCGPWPGWSPSILQLGLAAVGLAVLARPRGRDLAPWALVALAVVAAAAGRPGAGHEGSSWQPALESHCDGMLRVARRVATDPQTQRVFASTGEVVQPEALFRILARSVGVKSGRTVFLADDRGRLVAWAGKRQSYPGSLRPLGGRRWQLEWWVGSVDLIIREPILHEGRLVGAVTVVDRASRSAHDIWGMRVGRSAELLVSPAGTARGTLINCRKYPGVTVRLSSRPVPTPAGSSVQWWPWLGLVLLGLAWQPAVAVATVASGALALAAAPASLSPAAFGVSLLAGGAAVGRLVRVIPERFGRWMIALALAAIPVSALLVRSPAIAVWLPSRAFRPGWGAVWMVAAAWVISGWRWTEAERSLGLARRLLLALGLAGLGLAAQLVHVPVSILAAESAGHAPHLRRGPVEVDILAASSGPSRHLEDLAGVLGERLRLREWRTPGMLIVTGQGGERVSQWGDLSPAGDAVRRVRSWRLLAEGREIGTLELVVAVTPWGLLRDWPTWESVNRVAAAPVWFGVYTRSGQVAASLHSELMGLEPAEAGKLFHAGGGWTMVGVGETRRLAHVTRRGDWLVAAVARYPLPAVWFLRTLLALLWAMLGAALASPPRFRWDRFATFGGRLRLLVTGAVILPLILLTVFLHQRLRLDGMRLEQVIGGDALRGARWTALHLAGGFPVDEGLARWMGRQVGGEVLLFDGVKLRAASRPDLVTEGRLPGLPTPAAYARFILGRDDPVVVREGGDLLAAGGIEIQGQRYLLEVLPADPLTSGGLPDVVDWLLTGAVIAALLALLVTSRVELRLGASMRVLVDLSERVERGEPVGEIEHPKERDLAQVLDAVRLMSQEVQRREGDLRSQEELLRITLSTLSPAVVVYDSAGDVRLANASADDLLREHPGVVAELAASLGRSSETGGRAVVSTVNPFAGRDVTWRVGVADVPLPDGRSGRVAVVDDVSEVVQADRFRQLNQLARIVAHEVKNPLTPIRLWVQELEEAVRREDPELPAVLAEACSEISAQVARLEATAISFSNLVALERWEGEQVDLREVVDSALAGMKVLERRGIRVTVQSSPDDVCSVIGDRNWLRRAIANLIQNSVDVLRDAPGEIVVRLERRGDRVVVEVRDTGGGVPEKELSELFNPRFSTTSSGTGLGLALVRHVVTRCHGTVTAANGESGLVVRLELPSSDSASATMSP